MSRRHLVFIPRSHYPASPSGPRLHIRDSGFPFAYRQFGSVLMRWNIALEYSTADLVLDRTN